MLGYSAPQITQRHGQRVIGQHGGFGILGDTQQPREYTGEFARTSAEFAFFAVAVIDTEEPDDEVGEDGHNLFASFGENT